MHFHQAPFGLPQEVVTDVASFGVLLDQRSLIVVPQAEKRSLIHQMHLKNSKIYTHRRKKRQIMKTEDPGLKYQEIESVGLDSGQTARGRTPGGRGPSAKGISILHMG